VLWPNNPQTTNKEEAIQPIWQHFLLLGGQVWNIGDLEHQCSASPLIKTMFIKKIVHKFSMVI
jgi:hypothetical protein